MHGVLVCMHSVLVCTLRRILLPCLASAHAPLGRRMASTAGGAFVGPTLARPRGIPTVLLNVMSLTHYSLSFLKAQPKQRRPHCNQYTYVLCAR